MPCMISLFGLNTTRKRVVFFWSRFYFVKRMKKNYRELHEQRLLSKWLWDLQMWGRIRKFTTIPNSTYTPYWSEVQRAGVGLHKGLPDFFIVLLDRFVWLELKAPRPFSAAVSPEQKEWIALLNMYPQSIACVAYGFEDAKHQLTTLIGDVSPYTTKNQTEQERREGASSFQRFIDGCDAL